MIVAGEASGDMHGANLIKAMRDQAPGLSVCGMGGPELIAAGMTPLYDAAKLSVVGLSEVFSHIGDIRAALQLLTKRLADEPPDLLILIDLPDFNLMLAKKAKKLGVSIYYYISPQVWAWRSGRINKIKRLVNKVAVILPFEKEFYAQRGMEVDFVGHPLIDSVKTTKNKAEFLNDQQLDPQNRKIIGILPGSRRKEVSTMLPIFLETARILEKKFGKMLFLVPVAATLDDSVFEEAGLSESGLDVRLIRGNRYELMSACDVVLAASGTVTLELAILNIPMVVAYRVSTLSHLVGHRLIKVRFASLVNIIADREVVPELLQDDATSEKISRKIIYLLESTEARAQMKKELLEVTSQLGEPGASARAASLALTMVGKVD